MLVVAVVAGLLAPASAPASTAQGLTGERVRTIPVWEGIHRDLWQLTNADGDSVRAQVARVAPDAPVDFDLAFARDRLAGLETVPSMARRRVDDGVVLGINGGFWQAFPWGRPDGFTVDGGRLVTEGETRGHPSVGRGAFGLRPDGEVLVDRIRPQEVRLTGTSEGEPAVTGINRLARRGTARVPPDGDDALYLVTDQFGPTVTLPEDPEEDEEADGDGDAEGEDGDADEEDEDRIDFEARGPARWRRVEGLTTVPQGPGTTGVTGESLGEAATGETLSVPDDGALLLGFGTARETVTALAPQTATAETSLEISEPAPGREADRWAEVALALTGGPHILRDGERTEGWDLEGFGPAHHSRHPRTAVGVTPDGTLLLVSVDARRDERSVGLGTAELASFFQELGAVEAVMLDGGGSTTMTQDTVVVNEPSNGAPNPVANALFVHHRETLTATERLAGAGREGTAAAVARAGFSGGADDAMLAAGSDFPDALAGGPLAAMRDAPLLLANPRGVADVTLSTLAELGVERVTVLGGEAAVPEEAVEQLEAAGYAVERIAGGTRFSTAAEIGREVGGDSPLANRRVVLASGLGFADALVAAAPAGMLEIPILLTAPGQLPGATREALAALEPDELVVVGGNAAVSDEVAREAADAAGGAERTRLAGLTRFATARRINEWAEEQLLPELDDALDGGVAEDALLVARGDEFPDALAGGPLGARTRRLLMIVPPWDVRADTDAAAYLDRRGDGGLQQVSLLGGFAALSSYQEWQLEQLTR
jgi:putative cell wall-binding protein